MVCVIRKLVIISEILYKIVGKIVSVRKTRTMFAVAVAVSITAAPYIAIHTDFHDQRKRVSFPIATQAAIVFSIFVLCNMIWSHARVHCRRRFFRLYS